MSLLTTTQNFKARYRSKNSRHDFTFHFIHRGSTIDIYCKNPPSLNGRDSNVVKTHLFSSGQVCFVSGKEPRTMARAQVLAAQWAEYFLEYRRTGIAQD